MTVVDLIRNFIRVFFLSCFRDSSLPFDLLTGQPVRQLS